MGCLWIHDVGYVKVGSESGGALSGTNVVNAGNPIPLKGVELQYGRVGNYDNAPNPGTFTDSELNFVSISNPIITIRGRLKIGGVLSRDTNTVKQISGVSSIIMSSGITSQLELDILHLLDRLVKTKGYKELYFDSTAYDNLIWGIGQTDTHTSEGSTYRHLHVRVKSFTATQNAENTSINWSMQCEVTS